MSKHTPGPWSFYDDSNNGKTNRVEIVAIGKTVARIYHSVPAEDLPNARLIAAAPELLEALNAMINHYTSLINSGDAGNWDPEEESEVIAARAAIAKAQGETACS
jgi:hypothetical protein